MGNLTDHWGNGCFGAGRKAEGCAAHANCDAICVQGSSVAVQKVCAYAEQSPKEQTKEHASVSTDNSRGNIAGDFSTSFTAPTVFNDTFNSKATQREKRYDDATGQVAEELEKKLEYRPQDKFTDDFKGHKAPNVRRKGLAAGQSP
ncbi:hypothetical protein AACH06_30025 [Ideonella sp. DXS29W]|uniref:Uncharacterized protein n=1 Tax=Ideonella lacteola TaxID=2984193 RepID=A0ABU9BYT8_9BURK